MNFNNRILIVDDNESIHHDFKKTLCPVRNESVDVSLLEMELFGDGENAENTDDDDNIYPEYELDSAYQGQESLEKVRQAAADNRPYALLFVDVRMPPGWDGIETISRIWKEFPYTEIAICTAYSDYSWDEIAEKLGNSDKLLFLTKPFSTIVVKQMALSLVKKWNLGEHARNYVANLEAEVRDRTSQLTALLEEVEKKNQLLEHIALHDSLTDLPNRALFSDRLAHRVSTADREHSSFSIFMLDLNKFKEINDGYGHEAGDQVLAEVASRIPEVIRDSDTVARLGGDEFAILLHEADAETSVLVANKILRAFDVPVTLDGKSFLIGLSIGIAVYPQHGEDGPTLLRHADIAMYESKASGDGFTVIDIKENEIRNIRAQLAKELEVAVKNKELTVNYQPIWSVSRRKTIKVECLCRWNHAARGMIPPVEFIPIAEQKELIKELTKFVMKDAVKQLSEWQRQGILIGASINLSARNFLDPELKEYLDSVLTAYNVEGKWITLEITEGMTINNPEKAIQIMNSYAEQGVQLSIDDYGTGYASLGYIKTLPVNEVKIDSSFVFDLNADSENRVIVKSTIELAHALNMSVVAEGVENQTILDILIDLGCDNIQGYYICKPLSQELLTEWLLEN